MWGAIAAALEVIKAWLGLKSSSAKPENTQAVEVANKVGADTADTARATRAQINTDEAANVQTTNDDLARVRSTDSLRDGSADVNNAIARANSHTGSDS